jgi:hypothetical protein
MAKTKWFTLKRNATLHHVMPVADSLVTTLKKNLSITFRRHVCVFRAGEQMAWHYDIKGLDAVAGFMLRQRAGPISIRLSGSDGTRPLVSCQNYSLSWIARDYQPCQLKRLPTITMMLLRNFNWKVPTAH